MVKLFHRTSFCAAFDGRCCDNVTGINVSFIILIRVYESFYDFTIIALSIVFSIQKPFFPISIGIYFDMSMGFLHGLATVSIYCEPIQISFTLILILTMKQSHIPFW